MVAIERLELHVYVAFIRRDAQCATLCRSPGLLTRPKEVGLLIVRLAADTGSMGGT